MTRVQAQATVVEAEDLEPMDMGRIGAGERIGDMGGWALAWLLALLASLAVWPLYLLRNVGGLLVSRGLFPLGAGLLVADQATKWWAVWTLKGVGQPHGVIPIVAGILELTYTENPGAAFGLLRGYTSLFIVMAIVTSVVIVMYLSMMEEDEVLTRVALVLILAGALGNLIDRIFLGHVIDFIHVHYHSVWDWPIFNLADAIIDVGVGLILLDVLRDYRRSWRQGAEAPAPA